MKPQDNNTVNCGSLEIAKLSGGDASGISVISGQFKPGETFTITDKNCKTTASSPNCTYRIGSGPNSLNFSANIPEPINVLKTGTIDPLSVEQSIVRYNLASSDDKTIGGRDNRFYGWVFDNKLNGTFSQSYIEVINGVPVYNGDLVVYSGVRRSDLINTGSSLLQLLYKLSGSKVSNIDSVRLYQVSPQGKEEAVAVLHYTIQLSTVNPERGLWRIDKDSLTKIPSTFPDAIPIAISFRVSPATDLGSDSFGITKPVETVYPVTRFDSLSKDERGVYINNADRLSSNYDNLRSLISTIHDPSSWVDIKVKSAEEDYAKFTAGFDSLKNIYSSSNALIKPTSFYGNLSWRAQQQ
ncbi:MAG: hypothetical protein HYW22_00735 [Candidatus Aenigmarchaeota archaeon]|nr:hypothetical protein [Candidatus Aenigmarchaeota archaeon]